MKISSLLSVLAIMALATAQNTETIVEPALDINVADAPMVAEVAPAAADISALEAVDGDIEISNGSGRPPTGRPPSGGFTAWSSPGLKGHKQRNRGTPGCYRLDGGAVGSFEGNPSYQYAFYGDFRCKVNTLFASSTAPIRRIDPIIYPRSVEVFRTEGGDGTPETPDLNKYTLVTWSQPNFAGDNEKYKGFGCINLDGSIFQSFQGDYQYTFYPGHYCQGPVSLVSSGGMSAHKKMNSRSVLIRK